MSYQDHYRTLGIERSASEQEIQRAYRALARKYHPDVSKEPKAEERFKEIGQAYEVLKDAEKKTLYDKYGQHWKAVSEGRTPPGGGPQSSEFNFDFGSYGFGSQDGDLGSIFEQVFGGRMGQPGGQPGQGRSRRRHASQNGASDQETELELGVGAAFKGGRRDIQFMDSRRGERRRLTVNVPAGVRDGQRIRLARQAGGGGDLFLKVRVKSDDHFRLKGQDVYTPLKISPHEAVLGGTALLSTLDGQVKIKIPAGSSTGRQIRLKGRGYPGRGGARGDLYAEIQIHVGPELSDAERGLYERLAEVSDYDPRQESE